MNCKDYEAKVMHAKINGENMKSLDEVIIDCLRSQMGDVKREELIHMVYLETNIDKEDLHASISSNLTRLEKNKRIRSGSKTGYWAIA